MGILANYRAGRALRAGAQAPAPVPGGALDVMAPASPWSDGGQLAQIMLQQLLGLPADALPVDRRLAMGLAVVARCRHALFAVASRLPVEALTGTTVMADPPAIVAQPERWRPRGLTFGWMADQMMFFGRSWLVATERDAPSDGGRARRFQLVPEHQGRYDDDGNLIGYANGPDIDPADVFRFDAPHEGLLHYGADTLRTAARLERAAARVADNPVPAIELHQTGGPELSPEKISALTQSWMAARRGENGGVGFTNPSVEAKVLGIQVEQLLIDGRRTADLALVRAIGAPAWLADAPVAGSNLTYSNTPARSRELLDMFAMPYLDAIAGRLSMDDLLPRGTWCRFNTTELLRGDFKERMEAYEVALRTKVYTLEQIQALEHGAALEA